MLAVEELFFAPGREKGGDKARIIFPFFSRCFQLTARRRRSEVDGKRVRDSSHCEVKHSPISHQLFSRFAISSPVSSGDGLACRLPAFQSRRRWWLPRDLSWSALRLMHFAFYTAALIDTRPCLFMRKEDLVESDDGACLAFLATFLKQSALTCDSCLKREASRDFHNCIHFVCSYFWLPKWSHIVLVRCHRADDSNSFRSFTMSGWEMWSGVDESCYHRNNRALSVYEYKWR